MQKTRKTVPFKNTQSPDFNKCHIYSYYSYANRPITYQNFGSSQHFVYCEGKI